MYWNILPQFWARASARININMRCIEMSIILIEQENLMGLTLTWDVLKLIYPLTNLTIAMRLTLTWDVLK